MASRNHRIPARLAAPVAASAVALSGFALGAAPGHATDNDVPLVDPEQACHAAGGTFSGSESGWSCTLPNGDTVWCSRATDPPTCGYNDAGKPASKKTKLRVLSHAKATVVRAR